jgi:hypothetical protein
MLSAQRISDRPIRPLAIHPTMIVKIRKMMTPTPRRLIPIYSSGRN